MSRLPLGAALLVVGAMVAGCSGDDESDSPAAAGSSGSSGAGGDAGSGGGGGSGGSAGTGGAAGGTGATGGAGGTGATGGSAGTGATGGSGGAAGAAGTGGTGGSGDVGCTPLPAPTGNVIQVDSSMVGQLPSMITNAQANDTFVFAAGTYPLDGGYLWISAPGVTLRSESGNPEDVVIDGGYSSTEIVTVAASDVTIAEITIQRAYTHPIHVTSSDAGDTLNTRIYRVHIIDPREQAIKINPHAAQLHYTDYGEVACSRVEMTDAGRGQVSGCYTGGVDAHQSRGWVIRDNHFEGFWCDSGLAEHAVHMWRGCRDTIVERNVMVDNARGVGFGMATSGDARTYDDDPCPAAGGGYVDHYGGIVRNNFVVGKRPELLGSDSGFDSGISFWSACNATAAHNTIVSTGELFSSIEWRFAGSTGVVAINNLATHQLRQREDASGTQSGNIDTASAALFVDVGGADLHLVSGAAPIDQGVTVDPSVCADDIDGDARGNTPDIGADERTN